MGVVVGWLGVAILMTSAKLTREEFHLARWLKKQPQDVPAGTDECRRLLRLVKLNVVVSALRDSTGHWFKRTCKCINFELSRPFGNMQTGYFARASGEPKGCKEVVSGVHILENGKTICGYKPHKTLRFHWCAGQIVAHYVECRTCERIINSWGF